MRIRYSGAKKSNVSAIDSINRESMPENYDQEFLESVISEHFSYVAKYRNSVVGYVLVGKIDDNYYLISLAVLEQYRRNGIAKHLIALALKHFKNRKLFLHVRKQNEATISMYQKFGFKVDSTLDNYYDDPADDAYLMCAGSLRALE